MKYVSTGRPCRSPGFTLVEIMIVVAIIAVLTSIAVPSFLRARERTQVVRFVNDIRIFSDAAHLYSTEHNEWPPDGSNTIPPELLPYLKDDFDPAFTTMGGHWDWDYEAAGFTAAASAINPDAPDSTLQKVDVELDDGDLSTGDFVKTGNRVSLVLVP